MRLTVSKNKAWQWAEEKNFCKEQNIWWTHVLGTPRNNSGKRRRLSFSIKHMGNKLIKKNNVIYINLPIHTDQWSRRKKKLNLVMTSSVHDSFSFCLRIKFLYKTTMRYKQAYLVKDTSSSEVGCLLFFLMPLFSHLDISSNLGDLNHKYADDSQIISSWNSLITPEENNQPYSITTWMPKIHHKLNISKNEFLIFPSYFLQNIARPTP